jgi:phosphatidylserine/phosphatidylglycerophosphate/cardiolipin synthase-like enzyme
LDAATWFLDAHELAAASGGQPRIGLQTWSSGNDVTAYAETIKLWARQWSEIQAMGAGDRLWDSSWLIGPQFQLAPLDAHGANSTVGRAFSEAALRGAEGLVLAWRNVAALARLRESEAFVATMAAARQQKHGSNRAEAYLDARVAQPTGSIHQKTVMLQSPLTANRTVAYVGGVDYCEERFDVFGSNTTYPVAPSAAGRAWQQKMSDLRRAASPGLSASSGGWHDTELRIDGPAAYDVALTFAQRWNERGCDLTYLPTRTPPPTPIPPPTLSQFSSDVGTQRTLPVASAHRAPSILTSALCQ